MHRDQVSPASLLPASGAASPPCRPVLAHQWRYGRCIEIRSHLHRHCRHQGRLRRLVVRYWFTVALWQMHRDQVSPASPLPASVAASPTSLPSPACSATRRTVSPASTCIPPLAAAVAVANATMKLMALDQAPRLTLEFLMLANMTYLAVSLTGTALPLVRDRPMQRSTANRCRQAELKCFLSA